MMDAKIEVYRLRHDAEMAVEQYKQMGFPNILVIGPLELIEGATTGEKGWLVLVTHAEVMTTGS